jgi:archaellum biogenesis ATPase FlaH
VYRSEREVKKKALDVIYDEINRIKNPSIMILTLSISIIKEEINKVLSYFENLRNTENIIEIKKKKILREVVDVGSYMLYREVVRIANSKISRKIFDRKESNKGFILLRQDGRMINKCQILDGESNLFFFYN